MEELINQLKARAGLSDEQAQKATSVFTDFIANNMSGDQLQGIVEKIPGLSAYSDKIPADLGSKLSDAAKGFLNRG
jgi:hypothetical protein